MPLNEYRGGPYDQGGWLKPSVKATAANYLSAPEPVLTAEQMAEVLRHIGDDHAAE